jgi:hypothetical protein
MMNVLGADRFIARVRSEVNQISALSNTDDSEANMLICQDLDEFTIDLCLNQFKWGVDFADMQGLEDMHKNIVFMQFKRSVGGHESRNFRTQSFEQNVQQSFNQPTQSRGGLFGLFGNNQRR